MSEPAQRRGVYGQLDETRLELRRVKRGARWLAESRDYWRERARAAEWGLNVALKERKGKPW